MTQDEIQIIIESNLTTAQKSELIKLIIDKKNGDVQICKDGNTLNKKDKVKHESDKEHIARLVRDVIIPAAKARNLTALRLMDVDKNYYTFTADDKLLDPRIEVGLRGNVYVGSYDDYLTPGILYRGNKLVFITDPWSDENKLESLKQSIKFPSEEEARFFGEYYHNYPELIPVLQNPIYQYYDLSPKIPVMENDATRVAVSFKDGGEVDSLIHPTTDINIANKTYHVAVAKTEEEKTIGLSKITSIKDNEGMFFVYEEPQEDLWFTMEDTSVDLDIIFIDSDGYVTSVHHCKNHMQLPIPDEVGNAQFVLEVKINSGIKPGDEVEEYNDEQDDELSKEEKEEAVKRSKMLVLDENGDVQMKLEGGERIFSRISTRKFIKAAIRAYKSDKDSDYKKVGKLVFNELNAQDGRKPEYVNAPSHE